MTTALDLFCGGAGGWSLGLHRAGVPQLTEAIARAILSAEHQTPNEFQINHT